MKIDLYTKSVLTVIAACLVCLCIAKTAPPPALAADAKPDVQTVKVEGVVPVRIAAVERLQNPQTGQWSEWQAITTKEQR
jgi:hypothetical protein